MNWLWAYFRRKAAESILAGVHDALAAGGSPSGLTDEQAARVVQGIASGAPPTTQTALPSENPIPQLSAAPEPSATTEVRRRPGRPRKFQEPPQ